METLCKTFTLVAFFNRLTYVDLGRISCRKAFSNFMTIIYLVITIRQVFSQFYNLIFVLRFLALLFNRYLNINFVIK